MRRIDDRGAGRIMRAALGLVAVVATLGGATPAALGQSESWDAVYIGSSQVGSMQTRVEPVQDKDRKLVRVLLNYALQVRRGDDSAKMEMEYGTIETPEGQVLRLDTRTYVSNQLIRVHGDVVNDQMALKITVGDKRQEQTIPWGADVRGPYGPEQSFARKPMQVGESRKVKTFVPEQNLVVEATLAAQAVEAVQLGGGVKRDLLRVEQTVAALDGKAMPEMTQTFWVDPVGQVMKTFNDNFGGMTTYRTTREAATRKVNRSEQFDLIGGMIVRVPRAIPNPEATRAVVYKLGVAGADPASFFANDRRQASSPTGEPNTINMTVQSAGPEVGTAGPEAVDAEYSRSNPLINSENLQVVRLARRAVGQATDPWAKAQAITHWVASNIKEKNFSSTFAPAEEVARNLSGDCTEHSVLTAAMCRAEGIPARVAIGLIYVKDLGGFGYHMWDEVYVNRRWVAVDAAFDQTQVDAVHLKLGDSSLDGVSPFDAFRPVTRVATKLRIEPVEIR